MTIHEVALKIEKKHYPMELVMLECVGGGGKEWKYRLDNETEIRFIDFKEEEQKAWQEFLQK